MGLIYLILALLIQNSYTETVIDSDDNVIESREILKVKPNNDNSIIEDYQGSQDWMDMFIGSDSKVFPTSSAALMSQAAFSNKTPEEQLEDIKEMAEQITEAIQSEMANLLSYAISITDKEKTDDNKLRRKRSVETPMDSTQLVMRLLKHIKSNNEYQNIAIEKMMSAQEIADKYGIEFNPDPEILSDLAIAANAQAKEMSDILKESLDSKNVSVQNIKGSTGNLTSQYTDDASGQNIPIQQRIPNDYNNIPETILYPCHNHESADSFSHYFYNYPESQIVTPPHYHQNEAVTPRPSFYDYISYNPNEYSPYCSMELMSPVFIPMDEPILTEPELIGEEFEETVSSKVLIDHEEPGFSTVNHVTTYTMSEKAHFRTPQIEDLPQQMQYYFFLM